VVTSVLEGLKAPKTMHLATSLRAELKLYTVRTSWSCNFRKMKCHAVLVLFQRYSIIVVRFQCNVCDSRRPVLGVGLPVIRVRLL